METPKKLRRKFSPEFKSKVALEAISGLHLIQELAEKYDLNYTQINEWRKTLVSNAHLAFVTIEQENNELQDQEKQSVTTHQNNSPHQLNS